MSVIRQAGSAHRTPVRHRPTTLAGVAAGVFMAISSTTARAVPIADPTAYVIMFTGGTANAGGGNGSSSSASCSTFFSTGDLVTGSRETLSGSACDANGNVQYPKAMTDQPTSFGSSVPNVSASGTASASAESLATNPSETIVAASSSGSAFGNASLNDMSLRASVNARPDYREGTLVRDGQEIYGSAFAGTSFYVQTFALDVLFMSIPERYQGVDVILPITFAFDGFYQAVRNGNISVQVGATSGSAASGFVDTFNHQASLLENLDQDNAYRINHDLLLRPSSADYTTAIVNIQLSLLINGSDLFADFTNTGKFRLDLPEGIMFTRGSGLSANDLLLSPVPVPGTLVLLATGLAALGLTAKRQRKSLGGPSTWAVGAAVLLGAGPVVDDAAA